MNILDQSGSAGGAGISSLAGDCVTGGAHTITTTGAVTSGGGFTLTNGGIFAGTRWKFCPDCGRELPADWKHCAGCGKFISATIGSGYFVPLLPPYTTYFADIQTPQKCAFDGLPEGAYNLYCGCPKCSARCSVSGT